MHKGKGVENITNDHVDANQNHNEMSFYTCNYGHYLKDKR